MKKCYLILITIILIASSVAASTSQDGPKYTSNEAWQQLKDGNARFVSGKMIYPHQEVDHIKALAAGQKPFVSILSCSDSRVPVEMIFDAGFGDLFVIRVAGNVCGSDELGTVDYGVEHLGTPLLVVLGHSKCGAVTAATTGAEAEGSLKELLDKISPSVQEAKSKNRSKSGQDLVPYVITENVYESMASLITNSSVIKQQIKEGKLMVVGGVYDLEKNSVKWLGQHPDQVKLLEAAPIALVKVEADSKPIEVAAAPEQKVEVVPAKAETPKADVATQAAPPKDDPLAQAVKQLEATVNNINQPAQKEQKQTVAAQPANNDQNQYASLLKEVEQLKLQLAELKGQMKTTAKNDPVLASILTDIESIKAENASLKNVNEQNKQKLASLDDNVGIMPSDNGNTQKLATLVKDLNTSIEKVKSSAQNAPVVKKGSINLLGFIHQQYYNRAGTTKSSNFDTKRARIGVNGAINQYAKIFITGEFAKTARLLDGYVMVTPSKAFNARFGQMPRGFSVDLTRSPLGLPFVSLSLASSVETDRDIGVSVAYDKAMNKNFNVNYSVGFFNGSGINVVDSNTTKNVVSRLDLKFVNQLTLSTSVYSGKSNNSVNLKNIDIYSLAMLWNWKSEAVEFEYIRSKVGGVKKDGWYLWGGHTFKTNMKALPEIQPVVRYEELDQKIGTPGDRLKRATIGTNCFIDKKFTVFQLNYQMNSESTHVSNNEFLVNFQVSFF